MNAKLLLLTLFALFVGSLASSRSAEDYNQYIRHFAFRTPPEAIRAAITTLKHAGTNAFPALMAHLQDKTPAEPTFFQGARIALPTIGSACFDHLQSQIEGAWPKGFRNYHILTPETVLDWLARHAGLSLPQLRVMAAEQALRRAEADTPKKQNEDFHQRTVKFLRANLAEAKRNAA